METVLIQKQETGSTPATAVVSATALTRRYGEGDTAVDALRGVDLEVARGKLTAVMGPSGSGKSTLMHLLAALDRPTSGYVVVAGTRLGELSDIEITKLRRKHIGFVFQFFNLLPMLTADENVRLPLSIAGEKPDQDWYEDLLNEVGLTGGPIGRRSSRVGSSSALRSRAPSSRGRLSCSRMSRPATSTRRRVAKSSSCYGVRSRTTARRP